MWAVGEGKKTFLWAQIWEMIFIFFVLLRHTLFSVSICLVLNIGFGPHVLWVLQWLGSFWAEQNFPNGHISIHSGDISGERAISSSLPTRNSAGYWVDYICHNLVSIKGLGLQVFLKKVCFTVKSILVEGLQGSDDKKIGTLNICCGRRTSHSIFWLICQGWRETGWVGLSVPKVFPHREQFKETITTCTVSFTVIVFCNWICKVVI